MIYLKKINELKTEIDFHKNMIEAKEKELNAYYNKLHSSNGFEYILYKNLLDGNNPSRAIEKSIEEYNQDKEEKDWISTRTAWRRYSELKNNK